MKILLISYGIKDYDGRLSELIKVANHMGSVKLVCMGINEKSTSNNKVIKLIGKRYLSFINYLRFLWSSIMAAKSIKNIDCIIADNLFTALPALIIKKIFKPRFIVQDVRELYFDKEVKNISGKFFCKTEALLMKKADVVLCANEHRSSIMKEHHQLVNKPIVFENIRFLKGEYNKEELDEKYKDVFSYKYNIVSSGGLSLNRNTDKLVEAMIKLPKDYGLFLIGEGTERDKMVIQNLIENNKLSNVKIIKRVALPELRYILNQCDIGIVNYNKKDLNNKYCASGKVYEYMAEGLPLVTTENLPLVSLCSKYGVGESDDNFYQAIRKISKNITKYKENVANFVNTISIDKYNKGIAEEIIKKGKIL